MRSIQSGTDTGLTNLPSKLKLIENGPVNNTINTTNKTNSAHKSVNSFTSINELNTKVNDTKSITEKPADNNTENSPLTQKQLEKLAQRLQDFVGDLNRGIEFSVDKDSGRDVIKVIDKNSGDILKQYPSEEVLTLISKLSEMIGGFVDTKV